VKCAHAAINARRDRPSSCNARSARWERCRSSRSDVRVASTALLVDGCECSNASASAQCACERWPGWPASAARCVARNAAALGSAPNATASCRSSGACRRPSVRAGGGGRAQQDHGRGCGFRAAPSQCAKPPLDRRTPGDIFISSDPNAPGSARLSRKARRAFLI